MTIGSNTSGHYFDTTLNADGVLYSDGSGVINSTTVGTAGQFLISNGAGTPPSFQDSVPISVSFAANLSTTMSNITGSGTFYPIIFDNLLTNVGGGYDNTTGIFTAPTTGTYIFSGIIGGNGIGASNGAFYLFGNYNGNTDALVAIGTGAFTNSDQVQITGGLIQSFSFPFFMNSGDTFSFIFQVAGGGTDTVGLNGNDQGFVSTVWGGFLL